MSVTDDLATLREALAIAWPEGDHAEPHVFSEALAALGRVEVELARLTARRSRYAEARYENCMEELSAVEAELASLRGQEDALDRAYQARDDWKAEAQRLREERDAAQREADIQMGQKLAAQVTLKAITDSLCLPLAELGNGWTEATTKILARIEEIVDEGERWFQEATRLRSDKDERDWRTLEIVTKQAEAAEARCAQLEAEALAFDNVRAAYDDLIEERDAAVQSRNAHALEVARLGAQVVSMAVVEARCARLQQALADWLTERGYNQLDAKAIVGEIVALAGPDTPADSQKTRPIFDAPYGQTINGHSAVILLTEEQIDLILHEFRDVSIVETLACSVKDELRRAKTALARDRADRQPEKDKT